MSLRLKIVLALTLLAAGATAAIGIVSYTSTKHELEETVDKSLDEAARNRQERPSLGDPDGDDDDPPGRPGHDRPRSFEQVLYQVIDVNGVVQRSGQYDELPVGDADLAVAASTDPNASARFDVTIDANAALANRGIYGGYVTLTPQGGGGPLRVPYAGLKGDYQSTPVLTPTTNGFPWLAKLGEGFFYEQPTGATYGLVGDDIPWFLVHFDHNAEQVVLEAVNATTGKVVGKISDDKWFSRNSSSTGFWDFAWNGDVYKQLREITTMLEQHYKDMQDFEFTVQEGTLYMLQTRNGKRTGPAAVRGAAELCEEGLIDEKTAVQRVAPAQPAQPPGGRQADHAPGQMSAAAMDCLDGKAAQCPLLPPGPRDADGGGQGWRGSGRRSAAHRPRFRRMEACEIHGGG